MRKRQVSFDSSINDTPRENPSIETDTGNDVDLVAFEGTQDSGYDSHEYESENMMAINICNFGASYIVIKPDVD